MFLKPVYCLHQQIRTAGVQVPTDELLKYSKLFEDEITLDNLSYDQLRAVCRLVEVSTVGTSYFLRFQIEMKLRQLEADDRVSIIIRTYLYNIWYNNHSNGVFVY